MRFLFGLFAGALVTLLIATALDAPTDQVVNQGVEVWTDTVARFHAAREELGTNETSDNPGIAKPINTPATVQAGADTDADPPAAADAGADVVAEVAAEVAAGTDTDTDADTNVEVNSAIEHAIENTVAPDSAPVSATPSTAGLSEAVVWTPFHSEASARGFANRLSSHLEHPFVVKKDGPAQYLVTYQYSGEANRSQLEQKIAYVTGAATP